MTTLNIDGVDANTVYALLPESLRDVVDLIGFAAAQLLIQHYGGTHIYIPHFSHATADHPIAKIIGQQHLQQMTKLWGGDELHVPKAAALARLIRNKHIKEDAKKLSHTELAIKYDMSERAIRSILSNPSPSAMGRPPRIGHADQLDLFKT